MGAKFWTAEEKQVFVDIIIPRSTEADNSNSTGEKLSWDALVPIMQAEMNKRGGTRTYSKNSLFQHWYQKVGPRAQRRGEADTMTIPSKASHHHRNRGENGPQSHSVGPSRQADEDYYNSEDETSDLEPFSQYISRRGAAQAISKAGRRSLFIEDTDEEDEADQIRQAQAHYRDPRYDEFVWRHNRDLLDDENDIPGKAEDEAYEAEQRGNKGGNKKRNGKKQDKKLSGKRPRHSLNDTMENDYEETRRLPQKVTGSPSKDLIGGLNEGNDGASKNKSNQLVDSQGKSSRHRHRPRNKAIPAGKTNLSEGESVMIIDSDDEDRPYDSPYQPRAAVSTFAQNHGSQLMGSRFTARAQRQPLDMRVEKINASRHANRDYGSFGYPEAVSGYGKDPRIFPSGYLSEQAEQRQAYFQQTTQHLYQGQPGGREPLRKHNLADEGMVRCPTSNERYQYAPQTASSTVMGPVDQFQSGHMGFSPRSSNRPQAHAQASLRGPFLAPPPREQGGAGNPSFQGPGSSPLIGGFTPSLLRNPHRERTSSPVPELGPVAVDTEVRNLPSNRLRR